MAVTVKVFQTKAVLKDGEWRCKDKKVLDLLNLVSGPYRPSPAVGDPDGALAKRVVRDLHGEIVKQDKVPRRKKGVIY